jgi:urease accessory protein
MRTVQRHAPDGAAATARLVLDYDGRRKARQRVQLADGQELALMLPRGTVLRGGDRLLADDGLVIAVEAAPERLSSATTGDPLLLARAAYHLGNRHVPLQLDGGRLRYRHDHVLDQMLVSLGLTLEQVEAPFEPEGGAYQGQGDSHPHGHSQGNGHDHDHGHD